jgi:hypothetical protein
MPVVIPDGLEEAWLEPVDGPALRALEPLMAPWDPAAWEAVKLETLPGAGRGPGGAAEAGGAAEQLDLLEGPLGDSVSR